MGLGQLGFDVAITRVVTIGPADIFLFDLAFLALAVVLVVNLVRERRVPRDGMLELGVALVAWLAIVQIVAFAARGPDFALASTMALARFLTGFTLFFATRIIAATSWTRFWKIYRAIAWLALAQAAFGVIQALGSFFDVADWLVTPFAGDKYAKLYGTSTFRALGTTGASHLFAGILLAGGFIWIARATLATNATPWRKATYFAAFVIVIAVFASLAKTEALAVVAGVILIGFAARSWRFPIVLLAAASLAAFPVLVVVIGRFGEELGSAFLGADTGIGSRLEIWRRFVFPLFVEYPWGAGWSATLLTHDVAPHNQYLQLLVEGGLVAFVLMAILIAAALRTAFCFARAGPTTQHREFGLAAVATIVAVLVVGLTVDILFPGTLPLFWALLGLCAGGHVLHATTATVEHPHAATSPAGDSP